MTQEIIELGKKFAASKVSYEEAKKVLDKINDEWTQIEKDLLEAMTAAGLKSIDIDGVGKLTMKRTSYPSVNSANKPTFFNYLTGAGHGDLLKLDVPTNTLTAFLKKHVEELQADLQKRGLNDFEAERLSMLPGYENVRCSTGIPLDKMDAEVFANDILKSWGASPFTKTEITFKK